MRTLLPGYPAVLAKLTGAEAVHAYPASVRRAGAAARGAGGRARPVRARRAASLRPPRQSLSRARRARLARQRAALRRARARRRRSRQGRWSRASRPMSCTPMTGRRRCRRPICTTTAAAAAGHGDRRSTTSPSRAIIPASLLAALGLPPQRHDDRRRRIFRRHRLPEGRPAVRRPHHHRLADLRARNPARPNSAWRSTGCCARAPPSSTASSTASTTRSGTRRPTRRWRRPISACEARQRRAANGGAAGALRARRRARRAAVRRRHPADQPEGARPAARLPAEPDRRAAASSRCSARRAGDGAGFRGAAAAHPGRVGCVIGYDEALAHLIQAGVDFLVVPSRFEPCGLTQLCALRYGAAPVVARVGGLADTVIDANEAALARGRRDRHPVLSARRRRARLALIGARARSLRRTPTTMRRLRLNGMRADVSWRGPAKRYAALYRQAREASRRMTEARRRPQPASAGWRAPRVAVYSAERDGRPCLPVRRVRRARDRRVQLADRRRRLASRLRAGLAEGARYGLRVDGPFDPGEGIGSTPPSCSSTPTPPSSTGPSLASLDVRARRRQRRRRAEMRGRAPRRAASPGMRASPPKTPSSTNSTFAASRVCARTFPERARGRFAALAEGRC